MKNILNEFKKFAVRGSVIDLAVGIIIGGAFNKIVSSLVNDVVMPPIGLLLGKVDFSNLYVNLGSSEYASLADARAAGAPTINYGAFLNEIVAFLLTALAVFALIRFINKVKDREEEGSVAPTPTTRQCPFCLTVISIQATRCPACTSELEKSPVQGGQAPVAR